MADSIKDREQAFADYWEEIIGLNFHCRVLISHYNKRITVYNFNIAADDGVARMLQSLSEKAAAQGLEKIWLKTGSKWAYSFLSAGVKLEATIPGYFAGNEPAMILARFLSKQRQAPSNSKSYDQVKKMTFHCMDGGKRCLLPPEIDLQWGRPEHSKSLANLYRQVFATYPFPIFNPAYLKRTFNQDVCYVTAWCGQKLAAAASAEIDYAKKNAEITDFATAPEWRSRGLAGFLLRKLESRLKSEGILCFYTIARSSSPGMNKVFAGAGYEYCGVLVKNCNISGNFEDMNVWSKITAN